MEKIYDVTKDYVHTRIDRWIRKNICQIPQGLIEKNLRNKNITVNKLRVKSSYKLQSNDKILLRNFNPKSRILNKKKYTPLKKDIAESTKFIIENNDNFAVLNKPSGLAVQSGTKSKRNLIDIISNNESISCSKPFLVHRIDKDTSGILIVAKNKPYAQLFTSLFRIRKIHKSYLSICTGEFENQKGELIDTLVRYEGHKKILEKAVTYYKVLDKNNLATLLLLNPITGRKHQIRKQLSTFGHTIFGDTKYNFAKHLFNKKNFLMLHAYAVKFMINEKKFEYKVAVPDYFKNMLETKKLKFPQNF